MRVTRGILPHVLTTRPQAAPHTVDVAHSTQLVSRGSVFSQWSTSNLLRVALYAAYGSNLDPAQMLQRAPHSPARGHGWLIGWRLTFGGEELSFEGALATVVEDAGGQVFVMLYDVAPVDEAGLDRWEGNALGLYRKLRVRVATLDGDEAAWLYVLNGYEGGLPSARYLGIIADAAEVAGAPDDYVDDLRKRPCS